MPLYNPLDSTAIADGTITTTDIDTTSFDARYAGTVGVLQSGVYYYCSSPAGITTGAPPVSSFRCSAFVVPNAVTISRIGADVSTVGESGSKVRLGIYSSGTDGRPSALVLDAGQILGDSATVQELTVSQALSAGVYWVGAVSQSAPTTVPTLRVMNNAGPVANIHAGTSTPVANTALSGFIMTSVTAALPGTFTIAGTASPNQIPRLFVKVA